MKECCHQRLEAFVVEQVMVAFVGGKTTTTRENLNQKYNQPGVKSLAEGHTGGDACGDCTSNFLLISSLHHKNSHGESWRAAHRCLEQTQQQSDCPTHVLLLLFKIECSERMRKTTMTALNHTENDSLDVPFPSMIRFSLTAAVRDVMDGRDS
ncbi:uncharacterized protein [Sinocyclocheilus grahami]|uniref:uncharacterized protein isoform X2 n=1 Tax=Sinocyclocheilus grahami TaxID=75366 RepID=UPI0007AD5AFC|nr:PREDICTED: uncharacterized protein LOC107561090 isoform X2 [Sinocyclocheilus grahami]XP_016100927.1 PREDICTED: uncharacterized protein LOC107561090 isoform X2 [Sinocyclocheilus grahami]